MVVDSNSYHVPGLTTNLLAVSDIVISLLPAIFTMKGSYSLPHRFVDILSISSNLSSYRKGINETKEKHPAVRFEICHPPPKYVPLTVLTIKHPQQNTVHNVLAARTYPLTELQPPPQKSEPVHLQRFLHRYPMYSYNYTCTPGHQCR